MIPELHRLLSSTPTLLRARRALYGMAIDFLSDDGHRASLVPLADRSEVVDSPLLHRAVHDAMATGGALRVSDLARVIQVARGTTHIASSDCRVPVLTEPAADVLLGDVLRTLSNGDDGSPAHFLTPERGDRFTRGLRRLQEGVDLAETTCPALLRDLLPHVSLIAMLDDSQAAGVHSASLRDYPGLVLTGGPGTALEAAEVIVHEAAHQKFFDLALVHDVLGPESDTCPTFAPPWREAGTRWPLEQCLAAFHAYNCLAEFADGLGRAVAPHALHSGSLLPHAPLRSRVIGHWLTDRSTFLGRDARVLVGGLLGVEVPTTYAPAPSMIDPAAVTVDPSLRLDFDVEAGPVLVGRSERPHDFYFLGPDSGLVLELLRIHRPLDATILAFARERGIARLDAQKIVTSVLSDLAALDLVSVSREIT